MRIDAHQHFWEYNPVRDAWIDLSMAAIKRDFLPSDLLPYLQKNDIDGVVAVQADQSLDETDFLLKLSDNYAFIKGVVGWIDLKDPGLQNILNHYSGAPKLKGFRHILQAENDKFMLDPRFIEGLKLIGEQEYTYDILVQADQLPVIQPLLKVLPEQKLVLDHLAKPKIKAEEITSWAQQVRELAQYEHVYCKLSGMVTEADWKLWQPEDFNPYLDCVLEAFGPDRCMYGSDWPVCNLAADYNQTLSILNTYIRELSQSEQKKIMGETATIFYNL